MVGRRADPSGAGLGDQRIELRGFGHRRVPGRCHEARRVPAGQPQRAEAPHAQARDEERRRLAARAAGGARGGRHLVDDPAFEVLLGVGHVARAVTPKAVAGHGQHQRRDGARIDEPLRGEVRAALEGPGPVRAVHAVQQQHQRHVGQRSGLRRHEQQHIGPLAERRALDGDEAQARGRQRRVGDFEGAEHRGSGQSNRITPLALRPASMSSIARPSSPRR